MATIESRQDATVTVLAVRVLGAPETAAWCAVAAGADAGDFEFTPEPATLTTLLVARTPRGVDVLQAMLVRGDALMVREVGRHTTVRQVASVA